MREILVLASRTPGRWLKQIFSKLWRRIVIYVLIAYLILCTFLYFLQDQIIFPRHSIPKSTGITPPPDRIEVWIINERGEKVEGWYLPPLSRETPHPLLVFFHGNAELIDFDADDFQTCRRWGMGVFLPEYRGYGRSQGKPGQRGIAADMIQFRKWLLQNPDIDPNRIVYFGRSLGGGVACQLARNYPPAALILQSTFTSLKKMARRYIVLPFFIKHPFDNEKVIASLKCPIYIVHGNRDTLIPVSHGQRLHQLAPHSVYREVPTGHNDMPMDAAFWQSIHAFLQSNGILPL